MPQPYSMDVRTRVVAAAQQRTYDQVAARSAVSAPTVGKWRRRARVAGSPAAKPHRGGTPGKVAGAAVLADLVAAHDAASLAELAAGYRARTGIAVSIHAVWSRAGNLFRPGRDRLTAVAYRATMRERFATRREVAGLRAA